MGKLFLSTLLFVATNFCTAKANECVNLRLDSLKTELAENKKNVKLIEAEYRRLYKTTGDTERTGASQTIHFVPVDTPVIDLEYKKIMQQVLQFRRQVIRDLKKQIKADEKLIAGNK